MIITIGGLPGSGKSTVAKYLAKKFRLKHMSIGDFRREMALKRGMTIEEFNKLGEKEAFTDKEADDFLKSLGKKDNLIIDARLGWHFIPKSLKIFLKVEEKEGAERIFMHGRKSEKKYKNVQEVIKANKKRIESDVKRYKKYYGLNPYKISNYDIIIDTSNMNIRQMCLAVEDAVRKFISKDI